MRDNVIKIESGVYRFWAWSDFGDNVRMSRGVRRAFGCFLFFVLRYVLIDIGICVVCAYTLEICRKGRAASTRIASNRGVSTRDASTRNLFNLPKDFVAVLCGGVLRCFRYW